MWKLWHRLFGAHYAAIEYGFGRHIRRVRHTGSGRPFVEMCGEFLFLDDESETWDGMTFDKEAWLKSREWPKPTLAFTNGEL